jgi:hypothetical protein
MKIFVSWSGPASRQVAVLLREWLGRVLQNSQPFVSHKDISKGAQWLRTISEELAGTSEGIICVTPSNVEAPWLNYEAGALAKTTGQTAVRTVLLGLKPSDLPSGVPVSNFQHTDALDEEEMWQLIESITSRSPDEAVDEGKVRWAFDQAWPELERDLKAIDLNPDTTEQTDTRNERELIKELLQGVKEISIAVAELSVAREVSSTPSTSTQPIPERKLTPNRMELIQAVRVGTHLEHSSFGIGPVVAVENSGDKKLAVVNFIAGQKKLLLRYAPVSIVGND